MPTVEPMTAADWESRFHMLLSRSGGRCEARTPDCLARGGDLSTLPRTHVSVHHRLPRRMGGTSRVDVDALYNLMLVCGSGVSGCHGWIESERTQALTLGFLIPDGGDPATVPVTLASRRIVFLDEWGGYAETSGFSPYH